MNTDANNRIILCKIWDLFSWRYLSISNKILQYTVQNCIYTRIHTLYTHYDMEVILDIFSTKLNNNSVASDNGECKLWVGPITTDGKYGLVSFRDPHSGKWIKRKAHRFCLMVFLKDFNLPTELDCSHVCHNSKCVNPGHISLEPHHINNNRIHCRNLRKCIGHGHYPACNLKLTMQ